MKDHSLKVPEARSNGVLQRSFALNGLFVLGLFYTLYFTRMVLLPLVLAALISFMFRPLFKFLVRLHLPKGLAAALILFFFAGVITFATLRLAEPARSWISNAPAHLKTIEYKLRHFEPAKEVNKAVYEVNKMADKQDTGTAKIEIKEESVSEQLFGWTTNFMASAAVLFACLYFLLAFGDELIHKAAYLFSKQHDRQVVHDIAHEIEHSVSRYMSTLTLINLTLGVLTWLIMSFLGMPHPVLWGVTGGLLNFIPYIGAYIQIALLGLVSVVQFELQVAWLPPFAYWVLTSLESTFVTPLILGRRFMLNPILVFLSFIFWGWLWGIIGMLVAVPILVVFKIVCDHVKSLAPVGEFLSRQSP